MEARIYMILLLLVTSTQIRGDDDDDDDDDHHHHHHHQSFADCTGDDCHDVTKALEHIGKHFDKDLCHVFRHINCLLHPIKHDETVCGSDGHLYQNHCYFVKARCFQILNGQYHHHHLINPLETEHHKYCRQHSPSTSISQTLAILTTRSTSTNKPSYVTTKPTQTTPTPTQTTSTPTQITSTQLPMTTTPAPMSANSIVGSVFCQYRGSIDCGMTLSVLCATDGQFYPNTCEMLKEQCMNLSLQVDPDSSHCIS